MSKIYHLKLSHPYKSCSAKNQNSIKNELHRKHNDNDLEMIEITEIMRVSKHIFL